MPRGGVPSHSKHFCTLNPKVFGFHVSMQMGNAWQGHFHAKSIWYAGLTTRIMFMIEKAFSCPPRSSLRIGNLLRAIFRVRLHTIWHFYELYSSAAFFSLRIRWNFQSWCQCFKTFSNKSVYGENCSVCTVIRYSRVNIGIFFVSEASVLLKTVSVLKIYTFVAIQQQPIHFRSPEGKLVEKTFCSGYWLRSYWFYCVTVGLEL